MKLRLKKSRRTGGRELVVTLQRGEALNPHQAAWLRDNRDSNYAPFTYEYTRDVTDAILAYDIDGLTALDVFLRRHIDEVGLSRMLISFAEALTWCARGGNDYSSMLFDAKHVYVTAQGKLCFIFLPIDNTAFRVGNSPLTLLRTLSDSKRIHYPSVDDITTSERLADHVLNADNVFSFNAFRTFLVSNCGVDVAPDGTVRFVDAGNVPSAHQEEAPASTARAYVSPMPWAVVPSPAIERASTRANLRNDVRAHSNSNHPVGVTGGNTAPVDVGNQIGPMPAWQSGVPQAVTTLFSKPRSQPVVAMRTHIDPIINSDTPTATSRSGHNSPPAPFSQETPTALSSVAPRRDSTPTGSVSPVRLRRLNTGETYDIGPSVVAGMGRGSENIIQVLGNDEISRIHACVTATTNGAVIRDLGSQNGTFINGRRLEQGVGEVVPFGQGFSLAADSFVVERP